MVYTHLTTEPISALLDRFRAEMRRVGIHKLEPHFYISDEWGVPDGSISIAIPAYLVDPDIRARHEAQGGLIEGVDDEDLLRYLRHELGHVVNYAYRVHEDPKWTRLFGDFTLPYPDDDFLFDPTRTDFVEHLPGCYAQRHPDDDWAETFAVWMGWWVNNCSEDSPYWRYKDRPLILEKLDYVHFKVRELGFTDPLVAVIEED